MALGKYAAIGIAGIASLYASQAATEPIVGQKVQELLGQDLKGKPVSLEQYLGKGPVILNFFEQWCGPCKAEMPSLDAFARKYRGKVQVVIATTDGNRGTHYYMETNKYVDSMQVILLYSKKDQAPSVPMTYIIDRNGIAIAKHANKVDFMDPKNPLQKTLDEILTKKK